MGCRSRRWRRFPAARRWLRRRSPFAACGSTPRRCPMSRWRRTRRNSHNTGARRRPVSIAATPRQQTSATRRFYEEAFSLDAYARTLAAALAIARGMSDSDLSPAAASRWCIRRGIPAEPIRSFSASSRPIGRWGRRSFPVAISSDPGFVPGRDWIWRSFKEATPELDQGPALLRRRAFRRRARAALPAGDAVAVSPWRSGGDPARHVGARAAVGRARGAAL